MADKTFLNWPFFDDHHRALSEALEAWCEENLPVSHDDVDAACIALVQALGDAGFFAALSGEPGRTGYP